MSPYVGHTVNFSLPKTLLISASSSYLGFCDLPHLQHTALHTYLQYLMDPTQCLRYKSCLKQTFLTSGSSSYFGSMKYKMAVMVNTAKINVNNIREQIPRHCIVSSTYLMVPMQGQYHGIFNPRPEIELYTL